MLLSIPYLFLIKWKNILHKVVTYLYSIHIVIYKNIKNLVLQQALNKISNKVLHLSKLPTKLMGLSYLVIKSEASNCDEQNCNIVLPWRKYDINFSDVKSKLVAQFLSVFV